MSNRAFKGWVLGGIFALLMAVFVWGFILNGAYDREAARAGELSKRLDAMEAENRLTRVYVNDLWRRVVAAGIQAPPPPWPEPKEPPP